MDGSAAVMGIPQVTAADIDKLRNGPAEDAAVHLQKLLDRTHSAAVMHALLGFPDTMRLIARNAAALNKLREEFYAANPAMRENQELLATAIAQVESDHPEWTFKQILDEAAYTIKAGAVALRVRSEQPVKEGQVRINTAFKGVLNASEG